MSRFDFRVLFFGMLGEFSVEPLQRLIGAKIEVCGVVAPGENLNLLPPPSFLLPVIGSTLGYNILSLAHKHNIPTLIVKSLKSPETLTALAGYQPDVICVACWPQKFPRALLDLPPLGCLNLHASWLPAYRGPAPLFWQFRQGEARTGVTVHFMDEGADTGDIALQQAVEFPDGIGGLEADRLCASVGAELMAEAVRLLERGECPRQKQPEVGASYFPWPTAAAFEIPVTWPVRRAFNFMRGTEQWGTLYSIRAGGATIKARRTLASRPGKRLGKAWEQGGEGIWIQFSDGVLQVENGEINALGVSTLDT